MDLSPPPLNRSYSSTTPTSRPRGPRPAQPSTPSITPPTPVAGPSSAQTLPPSLPSSYQDMAPDPEDAERQTNRRSMYRSPGTSSSPDLATLLRKARERGGVPVGTLHKKDKRRESPPPLPSPPDRPSMTTRPRSSTTYSPNPTSSHSSALPKDESKTNHDDRISTRTLTMQRQSRENGISKLPKPSVRSKTSAFFGKVLGQGTVRERSKTDAAAPSTSTPTYSSPSLLDAFTPPVPALPVEHQKSPTTSPIADVFSTTTRAPNLHKVLPPIQGEPAMRESDDSDERSMVFIDQASLPNPHEPPEETPNVNATKLRSVSDGDVDLKTAASTITPSRAAEIKRKNADPQWEDTTFHGILNDFKGELSQLDPVFESPLDLRDPSTPSRRIRAQTDNTSGLQDEQEDSETLYSTPSTPQSPGDDSESNSLQPSPIVPPRTTSLLTASGRSASGPALGRTTNIRPLMTPVKARSGPTPNLAVHSPRESNRLRMQHRSTASSSEPSLIPTGDKTHATLTTRTSSHQDLSVNDLARQPSSNNNSEDEPADMDARGKELASRCWNEDEDFLAKEKIAEWLGGHGRINKIALRHYIDYFDFSGLRLDLAFRRLCAKLYLKGETQQVDRILETFSGRYWDCNPGGLYGSANIVHAVSYSLLLLNTDLHVAELQTRMSRNQFVRNTLTAVQSQLQPTPASPLSISDLTYDDCSSIRGTINDEPEIMTRSKRSDSITSWNSVSRDAVLSLTTLNQHSTLGIQLQNGSTPSIQISTAGQDSKALPQQTYSRAWENDMESLLKEMYSAIKSQQILQPLNTSFTRSSLSSLSPGGTMMRNRSLRVQPDRLATLKRGSIRGLQSILSAQSSISPYSSNSSIEGRVSPSPSFATSTHEAIYGSSSSFLTPILGFASNLSHTIIREAQEDDDRSTHSDDSTSTTISISDEELALLGAPWAKEGMLCRKHYWEATGKRAKDKSWLDVFVVIQKGELNMFTFGDNGAAGSGTFGGGNWLANAHSVGSVHLSHALAHALPPPGYNRQRPYCMVLTLSNGGVYFFQAGTEELVNEWVSTCNYWAARTSKEPLAGGVSNMEYGWNRVLDPSERARAQPNEPFDQSDAISVRSGRSSRSKFGWREGATVRGGQSPWADKTFINDWKPPLPPTVSSLHDEETQLEALRKHVKSMKLELESHNELREPMATLYQPRTANAMKAQSNWEKKSQHLLTEIVKYESYIDSLQAAMSLRLKKRGEKALERALNGGNPSEGSPLGAKGRWKGPDEATIREEIEPTTPGGWSQFPSLTDGRETAEVSTKE